MPHETPLIATIVAGLGLAFLFAFIAHRLRMPLVAGYLMAGVAIGPHTPGFIADPKAATELAEIGVILLMFGVGLHFSLKDLWSVRAIAVPGALLGITAGTALGFALAGFMGWPTGGGVVFGLALSVASTVVLLRALQGRRLLDTERGKIAVGWLVVEDVVMVLALVVLPAVSVLLGGKAPPSLSPGAGAMDILAALGLTIVKLAAFLAVMLVAGRRLVPWLLHHVAYTGSRELFRLAVFSIALGVAYGAAKLFGVSFALGAFLAGMILSESTLSQQAANESLPLRDAFAVLFFVSVGMLFEPMILVRETWPVLATVLIIVLGKPLAAMGAVLAFGYPLSTALTIAASLAQIGEFSFILAALGLDLGLLTGQGRDLILAGAILSILVNPLFFLALDRMRPWLERREKSGSAEPARPPEAAELPVTSLAGHTILVGFGSVGSRVVEALHAPAGPLFVVDDNEDHVAELRARGIEAVAGNATAVLKAGNPGRAKAMLIAIADSFEAGQTVAQARAASSSLRIIARAHSQAEAEHLRQYGADIVVLAEEEIAEAMVKCLRLAAIEDVSRLT